MTVTRKQAETMLAAVKLAKFRSISTPERRDLEATRLMLVAAIERISQQEAKSMLRVPA